MAINNPVITDSDWLQATAAAIQNKDGGSKMEVPDFASRIENIPSGWANPTSFVMVSDIQYADEVLPVLISACPDNGQWFIGKADYANSNQASLYYVCMGGYVIRSSDGNRSVAHVLRCGAGWDVATVDGHYNAAVHAGDKFYIYDISSIPT